MSSFSLVEGNNWDRQQRDIQEYLNSVFSSKWTLNIFTPPSLEGTLSSFICFRLNINKEIALLFFSFSTGTMESSNALCRLDVYIRRSPFSLSRLVLLLQNPPVDSRLLKRNIFSIFFCFAKWRPFVSCRHVTCPILTRDLSADLLAFTDWSPPRQHRYIRTDTRQPQRWIGGSPSQY